MPGSRTNSLKDPEMYEALRDDGASKGKAARISNAAAGQGKAAVSRKGGESGSYEDWTVKDLKRRAKELGLKRYSSKTKSELIDSLRND